MSRGKRYSGEGKLNIKKVFAVIIAISVITMFVFGIKILLNKNNGEKITSRSYYTAFLDNKYGVINSKGETVIEPSYAEYISIPNNKKDVFICTYDVDYTNNTYKTKALNSKNQEIFKEYQNIEPLENFDENNNLYYEQDALKVQKNGKYGLIDFTGKEILSCNYDKIETLKGIKNSIIIQKDGKSGLIQSNGIIVINPEYKEIKKLTNDYKSGYIVVNNENKYGIVDCTNKIIIDTKYDDIKPILENGIYVVKENSNWKIINKDSNIILENKFDDVKGIIGNNIIISKSKKYGVIDINGKEIIPIQYDDIDFAFTDTYIVKKDNKYGLIKANRDFALDIKYLSLNYIKKADFLEASDDGIKTFIIGNDWAPKITGIISELNIERGYMRIRVDDTYKYYNFKFEEKQNTDILNDNTLFLSKKNDKYGYTDKNGNVIVDYKYEDATEQNEYGYVSVKENSKWGSLDKEGKIISETKYVLDNNIKIDFIGKWHITQDLNMNCYTK